MTIVTNVVVTDNFCDKKGAKMAKDTRSRKWILTINNPAEKEFTHEKIKLILNGLPNMIYWCMCDEIGEKETYHIHIYFTLENAIRFSTLSKIFAGAHFDMAKGTSQQNRDYIRKEGKWEKDKKKETNLPRTFEEFGEMPVEQQGKRNDIDNLYDMIKDGMSNYEIMEANPTYMLQIDKIERTRQIIREEKYKNEFRKLEVKYIYGETDVGKSRGVMEMYGYPNVYRVTDYDHPFDSYKGQDVIMFEEYRSGLRIHDMLNYLDGYPLELPCRYANKVACYTKVYITTNISLDRQYEDLQKVYPETWKAFLRRIDRVIYMTDKLSYMYTVDSFNKREEEFVSVKSYNQEELPFK